MNNELNGVPLREAAERLGLTVDAVRMRIKRKSIQAYKADGRWYVVVPERDQHATRTPLGEPFGERVQERSAEQETEHRLVRAEQAEQYLVELRDQWLMPLIKDNGDLRERIGRLEAERDELHARIAALEGQQNSETTHDTNEPPRSNLGPFRRWWPWGRQ